MRRPHLTITRAMAAGAAVLSLAAALGAQSSRTVWDGVYTDEQADRGATLYADRCAKCHGDGLGGIESAPGLTGTTFYANWEGETLEALFERMRSSMPADKPGSLSRAQNADLLAHILKVGGYPAGTTPLDGQAGALTPVTIRMYKP
jgi:mono/diheme cytochrome c family protein